MNFYNLKHLLYIAEIRMSRQKFAATQALEIFQDFLSNCSGDEDAGSENEEMITSTVARVGEFELSSLDSNNYELDPPSQPKTFCFKCFLGTLVVTQYF